MAMPITLLSYRVLADDPAPAATVNAYCHSLILGHLDISVDRQMHFTTFDADPDRLPLYDIYTDSFRFGEELRVIERRSDSWIYRSDFIVISDETDEIEEWGYIALPFPIRYGMGDGVPDWLQQYRSATEPIQGDMMREWPASANHQITGSFARENGQQGGHYTFAGGSMHGVEGIWRVDFLDGTATYDFRTQFLTFSLRGSPYRGRESLTSTEVRYSSRLDELQLPPFTLQAPRGSMACSGATLVRKGKFYRGMLRFDDGYLLTSWPDFQDWTIEILDPHDSDGDGIPDISDPNPENAISSVSLIIDGGTRLPVAIDTTFQGRFDDSIEYTLWQSVDLKEWKVLRKSTTSTPSVQFVLLPDNPVRFYRITSP